VASNGREANDVYRQHGQHIAVVILDVCMPGLDGPQTLDALRKHNPEIQACFMTGNPDHYEPDELLQRGAAFVVAKPFLLDELANRLHLLVHGRAVTLLPEETPRHGGSNTTLN
jgi:CheY-like chemotaxis protein